MIRHSRVRIGLIPDLLFFARVFVLGFIVIIVSAFFIDYAIIATNPLSRLGSQTANKNNRVPGQILCDNAKWIAIFSKSKGEI